MPLSAEGEGGGVCSLGFPCLRSWFLVSVTLPPSSPNAPCFSLHSTPTPPSSESSESSKSNTMSGIGASVRFEEEGWNGRLGLDDRGGGNGIGED